MQIGFRSSENEFYSRFTARLEKTAVRSGPVKGTIRVRPKKDGTKRYYCQVFAGLDPKTGKKRYLTGTATSEREAHRVVRRLIADVEAGHAPRERATLNELIEAWLQVAGPPGEATRVVYDGYIRKHITNGVGRVPVSRLRVEELDRWYAELRKRGLAPASIRKVHNIIRGALTQGVKWGWIGVNVAAAAKPPPVPKPVVTTPEPAIVRNLVETATAVDPELATFLRLSAVTGARPGEMCGLRWQDLDETAGELEIKRRIVRAAPRPVVQELTKTGKTRRIPLDPQTCEILARHRQHMEERAEAIGTVLHPNAYLFSDAADGSEHWRPDSTSRRFRTVCQRSGVRVTLYALRHQAATTLIDRGVDAKTVSERLGNSVATVLGTYTRARSAADRQAASIIARALDGD